MNIWISLCKFLKIFIQFFIGYPNTCTWCGIHAVICSWLYELLRILKSNISETSARVSWGFQTRETFCFRAFGNLMKPEARVFEITSPTKKIIIWISFLNSAILFETWNVHDPQDPHLIAAPWQFLNIYQLMSHCYLAVSQLGANTLLRKANGRVQI